VFLEVWQMQGSEAKNSEVWQGKGLSDFWCWEAAVERSQRIPFELPMGILVLSVMVAKWRQVYAYGSCDRITNDHYRRDIRTRYRVPAQDERRIRSAASETRTVCGVAYASWRRATRSEPPGV
jgi:hypothetical protein